MSAIIKFESTSLNTVKTRIPTSAKVFGSINVVAVHPTTGKQVPASVVMVNLDTKEVTIVPQVGPHKDREIVTMANWLFDKMSLKTGLPSGRSWLKNFMEKLSLGHLADESGLFADE